MESTVSKTHKAFYIYFVCLLWTVFSGNQIDFHFHIICLGCFYFRYLNPGQLLRTNKRAEIQRKQNKSTHPICLDSSKTDLYERHSNFVIYFCPQTFEVY